jgi:hypothetical protein
MIDNLGRINEAHADDGTRAVTTSFAYTWYSDTFHIQQQTTTLPAVLVGQNGSATSVTRKQWFDDGGRLAWSIAELGRGHVAPGTGGNRGQLLTRDTSVKSQELTPFPQA